MPRNGSGTFTLVSGNPVVTGTTIESNWANTTLSDIATAMTDSLSRSGQGGMTAALRIADGTQGAPGLGFANETGSGLYRAGTAEVWAVVQGAQTMKIDSTGVTVPAAKATSIEGTFVFNETGADKDARFEGDTDANLLFTDASTDRVGIGTNTPSTKLHVVGDVTVSGAVNAATVNATTLDLTNIEVTNIKAKDGTAAATITDSTGVVNFAADVGVGASTPTFGSGSGVEIERAGIATLRLENSSASNSFELYADSAANGINLRGRDSSPMNFWTANTLQMKLDSSGNLGLGVTPSAWGSVVPRAFQIGRGASIAAQSNAAATHVSANTYYDGTWRYIEGNSQSAARFEISPSGLGGFAWHTAPSGTAGNAISFTQAMTLTADSRLQLAHATLPVFDFYTGATLRASIKGTSTELNLNSLTSNPITFSVDSGEKARITSGGDLLVGTTSLTQIWSAASTRINLKGNATNNAAEFIAESNNGTRKVSFFASGSTDVAGVWLPTGAIDMVFGTNNLERARITSGGDLLVGTTSLLANGSYQAFSPGNTWGVFAHANGVASGIEYIKFYYNNGQIGSITQNGTTAVAYNTTSDYRLKDNPQPLTGSGAFIDALQPKTWNWKADGSRGVGFIAHEAQAVSPSSVVGEKDAVDADGKPIMQAMEYGSAEFIANIIAELQSLRARVAALEGV